MERAAALGAGGLRVAGGEVRSASGAVVSSDAGDALGDSALYAKALAADCKARDLHVWTNASASLTANGLEVDGATVAADVVVLCSGSRTACARASPWPWAPRGRWAATQAPRAARARARKTNG